MAVLPWRPDSGRVLRMFCDVCTVTGEPYEADTRNILKKAVAEAVESVNALGTENDAEIDTYDHVKL